MKRTAEVRVAQIFGGFPVRLQVRNDLHLTRKLFHWTMGLVIVFVYMSNMSRSTAVTILASVLGLDLLIEMSRLKSQAFNQKVMWFWGPFMRASEVHQMSTVPYYLSSSILAIGIFPKPVAILSILYLACGDPVASFFGILYGHKGPRLSCGKTLIGTLAGVLVCGIVTFIFLKTLSVAAGTALAVSVLGGLVGGMAELLPFDIDDNFTIPVISGFVLWLTFMVVGL